MKRDRVNEVHESMNNNMDNDSTTANASNRQDTSVFSYFAPKTTNTGALGGRTVVDKPRSAQFQNSGSSSVAGQGRTTKYALTTVDRGTIDLQTFLRENEEAASEQDVVSETEEKLTQDLGTKVLDHLNPKTTTFWLIRERTGEKVKINGTHFVVGKSKYSSYQVRNTTTVSRSHAIFSCDGNTCWIEDDKSTNGTSVNGRPLAPEQKVKLHDGDSIRMSDEMFSLKEVTETR